MLLALALLGRGILLFFGKIYKSLGVRKTGSKRKKKNRKREKKRKSEKSHHENQMQPVEVPVVQSEEKLSFSSAAHWKGAELLFLAWFVLQ